MFLTGGECPVTGQLEHKELNIRHSLHYDHTSDLCVSRGKGTASYNIVVQCNAVLRVGRKRLQSLNQWVCLNGIQLTVITDFVKLEKNHSLSLITPIIVIVLVKCQTNLNLGIWSNQFDALVRSKLNMK